MDDATKQTVVAAMNLLIRAPNAHALYQTLCETAPLMARHKELKLTGEAEALNPLAHLKVRDPVTYDSIIALIERKREEAGYDPLESPHEDKFDKAAYMQEFMAQKRLRQRRAADIENLQRADRDKLIGRSRLDFMQRQSAVWKAERDAFVQRAKEAAAPRRLKKEDLTLVLDSFWKKVDERLDALEAAARSGRFSGIGNATSLSELESVLRHDPYK